MRTLRHFRSLGSFKGAKTRVEPNLINHGIVIGYANLYPVLPLIEIPLLHVNQSNLVFVRKRRPPRKHLVR